MVVTTEDILQHVGVKGMKWGVRKSERSSSKAARREEHASKLDAKAGEYRSKIKTLEAQAVDGKIKTHLQNRKIKKLSKKEVQAIKDSVAKREGKMTRREKQIAIGAAVVVVAAAYTIGAKAQSGELNRLAMRGQAYLAKEMPSFKKNSKFAQDFNDPDDLYNSVVKGINDHSKIGGKVNCRRSTLTYELRRRGNDVVATRTTTGSGQAYEGLYNLQSKGEPFVGGKISKIKRFGTEAIQKERGTRKETPFMDFVDDNSAYAKAGFFGENKIVSGAMSQGVFRDLATQPDKARGELGFSWKSGGAHSVAWEIVGGKPVIFDTQTGDIFKDVDAFEKYGQHIKDAAFTRLDNKELNENFLMRWAKNAK